MDDPGTDGMAANLRDVAESRIPSFEVLDGGGLDSGTSDTDEVADDAIGDAEWANLIGALDGEPEWPLPAGVVDVDVDLGPPPGGIWEVPWDAQVLRLFQEALTLLLQKHQDYGPENISRAPGGPLNGLVVRLHDKQARIVHLLNKDELPNYESLRDSFIDMANYALIAVLCLDGNWPGVAA